MNFRKWLPVLSGMATGAVVFAASGESESLAVVLSLVAFANFASGVYSR